MFDTMKYANYNLNVFKPGERDCFIEQLNFIHKYDTILLKYIIKELNDIGLYPVWNMPGHRNTYYFPTEADCEIWEDYLYSMLEDE